MSSDAGNDQCGSPQIQSPVVQEAVEKCRRRKSVSKTTQKSAQQQQQLTFIKKKSKSNVQQNTETLSKVVQTAKRRSSLRKNSVVDMEEQKKKGRPKSVQLLRRTSSKFSSMGKRIVSRSFANSWISDRSCYSSPASTKTSRNVVIRRGRVKKRKKNENSHWKDVELVLYPKHLQYSYAKSIFSFTKMKKKSKICVEDIDTVRYKGDDDEESEENISQHDFVVTLCVPAGEEKAPRPWTFRTESAFVAQAWVKEIRNAMYRANPLLRERDELNSTNSRVIAADGGTETTIGRKSRVLSSVESDLFNSIVTSTAEYTTTNLSLAITLGGIVEKMSDHRKRWNERFLMYQYEARVFRYRRPYDPVEAWRDEHWYIGKWKGCRVKTIVGEPLAMELSGASTRSGETSSVLALRFKSQKQLEMILHILREAGVEIDVGFLKYLRHRPSHLEQTLNQLKSTEKMWIAGARKPAYCTFSLLSSLLHM